MTQKQRILSLLRDADGALVPTTKLNPICYRYSARIDDLRGDGHPIPDAEHIKGSIWGYRLIQPKQAELLL